MRKEKNELYRMKSEALREKNPFMSMLVPFQRHFQQDYESDFCMDRRC